MIASLSPPLLHGDILNDTESLAETYQLIRSYYHFAPSESTFLKFAALKRELNGTDLERPQHLYLRMRQFIRDNLLKKDGLICHDGNVPEEDETLSATTERLIVLRWLELLHPALPMHVANVFGHELQTKSLKDLQPLIVVQIDNLLQEVNQKEDFSSQISSTQAELEQIDIKRIAPFKKYQQYRPNHYGSLSDRSNNYNRNLSYSQRNPPLKMKQSRRFITKCAICKAAGEPFVGHDISGCKNVPFDEKQKVIQSYSLNVDYSAEEKDDNPEFFHTDQCGLLTDASLSRVHVNQSPRINFSLYNRSHTVTLDTGATASLIEASLCQKAGIPITPSAQTAVQADGCTELPVLGEINTVLKHPELPPLKLSALVVPKLACGLLAGMPFIISNRIIIDAARTTITVQDKYMLNNCPSFDSLVTEILRVSVSLVLFPGDNIDFQLPESFSNEVECIIEPRLEFSEAWPFPAVLPTNDVLSTVNDTEYPISIKRGQIIAQVRSLCKANPHTQFVEEPFKNLKPDATQKTDFHKPISIDPQKQLSSKQHQSFNNINTQYSSVFNPNFGSYNDASGPVRLNLDLGQHLPPPRKGRLPSYNSTNLMILHEKFDELEHLGIIARPEDLGTAGSRI